MLLVAILLKAEDVLACSSESKMLVVVPNDDGDAANWAKNLYAKYGLNVVSMQSILNGVKANMFGKADEQRFLIDYMKSAIDFAAAVKCRNLVFFNLLRRLLYK